MTECRVVIRILEKSKAEVLSRADRRAVVGNVHYIPMIEMGLGFKTWEICKHSFLKSSFIRLVKFQVNTVFLFQSA